MVSTVTTSVNIPWYTEMVKHRLKPINANKKNPSLKISRLFSLGSIKSYHYHCAKIIKRVFCPWSILNKFVQEQLKDNLKARTCNMHRGV